VTALPHYYSSLAPFRDVFLTGWPILTYHHVGPRQRGARLKGLYVSPSLFARQMSELHEAGFSAAAYAPRADATSKTGRHVWLTFDDGFKDVFEHGLPVLQKLRFTGIQFLVSSLLGKTNEWQQRAGDVIEPLMDFGQVREWLAAGQQIGSHTQTHPRLTDLSSSVAREEISASKKSLEDTFGVAVEHFCYPYGDWNLSVRDLVVEAGYKSSCTTTNGINDNTTSRFELKRFTARYPSRKLRSLWSRLRGKQG
jgi:peptidoglycan/xylan/chitin deacetylase (PgdA/CDA1 family)